MDAQTNWKGHKGFSLIELMVGIVIAMLGVLVMMQVSTVFEGQKRTTTSGSDAQTNGMSALFAIERDLRGAGYGLSKADAVGCTVTRSFRSAAATSFVLAPVTITDGASGGPDTIRTLSSSKTNWSLPSKLTSDFAQNGTNISVNTTLGMALGDLLVFFEAAKPCAMVEVTALPVGSVLVSHVSAGSNWNPADPATVLPATGYIRGAVLINMGSLGDRTFSVDGSSNLTLGTYASGTNTTSSQTVAPNIVNLQAQYGFDTRPGVQTDIRVDRWSSTMFNADGDATTGNSGDIARMIAVRIALVTRSAVKEKTNTAGVCDITTSAGANYPRWMAGNPTTGVLETTTIDVSKNPDGTANPDWQCHRYKVFDSVIPLRNLIWKDL
ncbi:MAG: PilW family protein [Pseudomonadota bacterium]